MTLPSSDDDASALLWHDTGIFHARRQKSAAALVAIYHTLEHQHPLGSEENEFLTLYRSLAGLDPEVFTQVWSDPYAYYWLRLTYELLGFVLQDTDDPDQPLPRLASDFCREIGDTSPRRALSRQLANFKRLLLGAHILAERDIEFDTPLDVELPLAIPGTSLTLQGKGHTALLGFKGKTLNIKSCDQFLPLPIDGTPHDQVPAPGETPHLESCPVVRYQGCELQLQPFVFNHPGLDFRDMVAAVGLKYQHRQKPLLESTLRTLQTYAPEVFSQFRDFIRVIAFKPSHPGTYRDNLSHSDFPGAIIAQPIDHPHYMAHVLVHEFHHNRLFCIEEQGRILEDSRGSLEEADRHYSPLRVDPRPMHGIVHGLYVFVPVGRYWLQVHRDPSVDPATRALALDQLLTGQLQMEICVIQIDRYARLTSFGQDLFQQLRADVETLGREVRPLAGPAAVPHLECRPDGTIEALDLGSGPMKVAQTVIDHITAYAPAEESDALLSALRI